jgi:hypothetical protein
MRGPQALPVLAEETATRVMKPGLVQHPKENANPDAPIPAKSKRCRGAGCLRYLVATKRRTGGLVKLRGL